MVSARVDLIWTSGTPAATVAQKATASIPVVFALVGDPVYSKLVGNLTDPGANLTGMSLMISEMWEKHAAFARLRLVPSDALTFIALSLQLAARKFFSQNARHD
jgi:ABC-type uncharacterized transport system substrate-binding protein